ncbi:putative alpha/beta hydrolase [Paraburkholderia caballeronis]|nr:alpha/beta fold hydrolase [Paraburkholderia caballeronis]TDV06783.1 putative alpha/beta hydrolase [Paraburkholderia caballeronis]TDV09963.1 putative alpha/beta hydrolase [Paraburkholderia caballeronis]TDV21795.1 putative alpha/beta hydrolase [Paraburkholderia caballeronis]
MSVSGPDEPQPAEIAVAATDGYPIRGYVWRHDSPPESGGVRPVAIVNAATSVRCRYYFRFAAWLHRHGYDALVYDYRGIGVSRPADLATLDASWLDWGERDFDAVLRYVRARFPAQPIDVVGHSIGGFLIGLSPSNPLIRRVFTMGAQYAYWRDYARSSLPSMLWKWHVVMPALTRLYGYFPASRLGWMEDTPRGVVQAWSRSRARFEDGFIRGPFAGPAEQRAGLVARFAGLTAPILAVSVTDDPFGTTPAIERALRYFTQSRTVHLRLAPASIGERRIGHFAFFNSRYESSLWPVALRWLTTGDVPPDLAASVVSVRNAPETRDGGGGEEAAVERENA